MEEFRYELVELINNYNLPLEQKFYIVKDVFRELNDLYGAYLQQKRAEAARVSAPQPEIEENEEEIQEEDKAK